MLSKLWNKLAFRRRLTKDRFARIVAKRLNAARGIKTVKYEPEQFRLVVDGQQYINLGNHYQEHLRLDPEERATHIESILQFVFLSGFELPEEFEDARHDLMPKVWPRAAFDRLNLEAEVEGKDPKPFATVPLGEHLYLGLVYDLPKSVRTIGHEDLDRWSVSLTEALEIARTNLRAHPIKVNCLLPRPEEEDGVGGNDVGTTSDPVDFLLPTEYTGESSRYDLPPDGRIYFFMTGDSFDASRLVLLPELEQLESAGRPVAVAPNRDVLLVAGANDEQGLTAMAGFATQLYENEPRPHVPIPMTFDTDGKWSEFRLDKSHPAYNDFHTLELKYLAEEYGEQKPLLEKLYAERYLKGLYLPGKKTQDQDETTPAPPFVASLLVAEASDGTFESHAVWAEDLDTLLPKADVVAFIRQEADSVPVQIPWADVMAVLDDLLHEVPGHYPPRYQVTGFPSDLALRILTEDENP